MTEAIPPVVAEDYSAHYFEGHVQRYQQGIYATRLLNVSDFLGDVQGKRVLDLGCGIGVFSRLAAEKGARVVSTDYSKAALDYCARTAPEARRVLHHAEHLPFKERSFDVVLAADIIEHLYDPVLFLSEVNRVLASGGRLVLSTDNESFLGFLPLLRGLHCLCLGLSPVQRKLAKIKEAEYRALGKTYASFMHVNCMRLERLLELLDAAGFAVKKWKAFPYIRAPLWDDFFALPLVSAIFKKVGADRMIVSCEKP